MPANQRLYQNSRYVVVVEAVPGGPPPLVHLSIRRQDRRPIHDWRDLQRIKNELVGPECEAVELYPAESRLVDTVNQFHLWVFADPTARLPFGFESRLVAEGPYPTQAVQRPFSSDARPSDVKTGAELAELAKLGELKEDLLAPHAGRQESEDFGA